ncbi:chlorocatechol-degradation protein [Daedalea quercina L-15889]|uniref:Chlorocatechol-degradation protein n=1 Tax=Daedalea quercina L-15889 TaxID=1314783 RepID=A0A165RIN5_9APHY|nr:chlorocatechol-degradation protein [Daedalea quercina L-15889]
MGSLSPAPSLHPSYHNHTLSRTFTMSLCEQCISGVRHEGTPEGKFEQIGGVECYVATPSGDYDKSKAVLFFTDAFGLALNNNKLLTDAFARNGYRTIIPDYMRGDPVPLDAFNKPGQFDMHAWIAKHGEDVWKPDVDNVVAALKAEGVTRIGTTGYCYGGPAALHLGYSNTSSATVMTHPSLLQPEDLERYRDESKIPLLINGCEVDHQFPPDFQAKADEIFKDFAPGYEKTYWEGCTHGFAVRGDISDPKVKAGKEGVFEATVKFFQKHL